MILVNVLLIKYFDNLFTSSNTNESFIDTSGTYKLPIEENEELSKPFSEAEIKGVIWKMNPNKQ